MLQDFRQLIYNILKRLLFYFQDRTISPLYLNQHLVNTWFLAWFQDPDDFWKKWILVNSPEADFVAHAILEFGED